MFKSFDEMSADQKIAYQLGRESMRRDIEARLDILREALELIADPDYTHLSQLKSVAADALEARL